MNDNAAHYLAIQALQHLVKENMQYAITEHDNRKLHLISQWREAIEILEKKIVVERYSEYLDDPSIANPLELQKEKRMITPKESIYTIVDINGKEKVLEIIYEADTISFFLDNEEVFGGDWTRNFYDLFKRAVNIWSYYLEPKNDIIS